MLITRECDYAVRIVRALADGEKLCVSRICEKEALTSAFVYKILKKMEKAQAEMPEPEPTPEERLAELEAQNQMLTQCLMEMSQIVYA